MTSQGNAYSFVYSFQPRVTVSKSMCQSTSKESGVLVEHLSYLLQLAGLFGVSELSLPLVQELSQDLDPC